LLPSYRVLLVLADPPLPFGRAMGRWFHVLLRGLKARGHRVRALVACNTAEEAEQTAELFPSPEFDVRCYRHDGRSSPASKLRSLRRPYSYFYAPALGRDLAASAAEGFDVLHLEVLWSGYVGRPWADRAVVGVPYLYHLDLADQPPRTASDRLLRWSTLRSERALLRSYPRFLGASPRLCETIRRLAAGAEATTVPFGLDLSLYPFDDRPAIRGDRPPTLGLIASFDWTPGVTAGRRILERLWPAIHGRLPEARLILAGRRGPRALAEFAGMPGVEIRDTVADPLGFFGELDLQLYPPNPSSGMKFKVLEAFALGVPTVTNAAGVEGLPALDGVHAGICEDDSGLIERTVALLRDPAARDRMRREARSLVASHCDPDLSVRRVEQVYEAIMAGQPVPIA
jgi:polysaccharide biosynthesis protein PslH